MKNFGLIGFPLSHSWSKIYFDQHLGIGKQSDYSYQLYELRHISEIRQLTENQCLSGFNVTIPYKEQILPYLDQLTPEALSIGAVNCVKVARRPDGRLHLLGHNTDCQAFLETFTPLCEGTTLPKPLHALVLGKGGASKAVSFALNSLGIAHTCLSHIEIDTLKQNHRLPEQTPSPISIVINATPVGMYPHTDDNPFPLEHITPPQIAYDLIYNPPQTRFLQECHHHGALTQNGLAMLHRQAELSWQFWGI